MDAKLIQHPILMEIGKKYKKTVPQIIIRWNYQNQVVPIVKSSNKERMRSNMDIFDFCLKDEDMESIECINENYRVRHNPDNIDFSKL